MINAYFLYFISISGVTKPTFVKKYIIIGNSNTKPQAREDDLTKPIKELKSISFKTSLETWYDPKKLIEKGVTT